MRLAYRGECHAHLGDYDRSVADFTAAIKHQPDNARLYACRAASYREKHDLSHALVDLDQVVRILPKEPRAYFDRLNARIDMGDRKGAMTDMDRIVQLYPRSEGAYTYRACVGPAAIERSRPRPCRSGSRWPSIHEGRSITL